jgi:hypothetical protein
MCGIFGFFNADKDTKNWNADFVMPELLFVNQLRGRDACGVFGAHRESPDHVDWCKMAASADAFLDWAEPHKRFFKPAEEFRFMVAHNRAATMGAADNINAAHPHAVGPITLVHNGTLSYYPRTEFESDSHYIAGLLADNKKGDFLEVERKINGAWALVWHDARDNSLNFVRNNARPLHFLSTDDKVLWFASEPKMAEFILDRKNKKVERTWELPTRLWLKMTADGRTQEINVPFISGSGKPERDISFEEYLATPECQRSFDTVAYGRQHNIRSWNDVKDNAEAFDHGRGPAARPLVQIGHNGVYGSHQYPRQPATFSSPPSSQPHLVVGNEPRIETGRGAGDESKRFLRLTSWRGFEIGNSIEFYPEVWAQGTKSEQISDFIAMTLRGPMAIWVEYGCGLDFVPGVKIHARVHQNELVGAKTWEEAYATLKRLNCVWSGSITSMNYDSQAKIINIFVKDAESQDWCNVQDIGWEPEAAEMAWKASYVPEDDDFPAESEVSAQEEKKSCTEKCKCGAGESQGMCFIPKDGRLSGCIFEPKNLQRRALRLVHKTGSGGGTDAAKQDVHSGGRTEGVQSGAQGFVQAKSVFVKTGHPHSVRCEQCRGFFPVWEKDVFSYHVSYHEPRKVHTGSGAGTTSEERVNVCEDCLDTFQRFYEDVATLTLMCKHGHTLQSTDGKPIRSFS